jgi:pSer/pThr/pTyr-binding forkhead associated (FHA) protein
VLATLEIANEGPLKGTRFDLRLPLTHVGRAPHNDVVLESESVSGSHAKLQRRDDGWFVVDMGSTNGTYVDGRRIDGEAALGGAADLRFGDLKLAFRVTGDAPPGVDEVKGTRAIAAAQVQQARAIRASTAQRPTEPPASPTAPAAGGGAKVLVAVVVVVALAVAGWFLTR